VGVVARLDRKRERTSSEPSDADLLSAALAGSVSAHQQLFVRHYPRILRLAYRLLGREDDAEDLAQDVCVEALRNLDRLRDRDAFEAWITKICVLRARSRIRRYALLHRLRLTPARVIDPDQVVSESAPPDVMAELRTLYRHIQRLPADVRIALVLRRVEGLEIAEIAERMGRSSATVKRRISEGIAALDRFGRGIR
jgi:RNA polymerase sigma-70 factor, ECF subfamily